MEQVREGSIDVDAALGRLRHMPFEDLGFAKVDHHRALRQGMPEVIFAMGKTPEQVTAIAGRLLENASNVLITRSDAATADYVTARIPGGEYFPASGAIRFWGDRTVQGKGQDRGGLRRHQRHPGSGGSADYGGSDGQQGRDDLRYRRGRHPPPDEQSRAAHRRRALSWFAPGWKARCRA